MTWRAVFYLVVLAAQSTSASGACSGTEACLKAIEAAQTDTRTIEAEFTQTKHVSLLDEPLVSTGRFLFRRPDQMRIDIDTPRPATILISGRTISIPGISASDQQQLSMTPMASMFAELGAMFSGSPATLRQHFDMTAQAAAGGIDVTLIPTLPDWQRLFRTIRLHFADPDLVVSSMQLDDALGDQLDIVMRDVHRNQEVPDSAFESPAAPAQ